MAWAVRQLLHSGLKKMEVPMSGWQSTTPMARPFALVTGTTGVYGEAERLSLPVREDVGCHAGRGYGKAKWGAEEEVWAQVDRGVPAVVLRPVTVYGPGATKLLASAILDTAIERAAGLPRLAVATEPMEQRLVHVDDLVAACIHLARSDAAVGRAFNVVDGLYPSSHDVAVVLAGC